MTTVSEASLEDQLRAQQAALESQVALERDVELLRSGGDELIEWLTKSWLDNSSAIDAIREELSAPGVVSTWVFLGDVIARGGTEVTREVFEAWERRVATFGPEEIRARMARYERDQVAQAPVGPASSGIDPALRAQYENEQQRRAAELAQQTAAQQRAMGIRAPAPRRVIINGNLIEVPEGVAVDLSSSSTASRTLAVDVAMPGTEVVMETVTLPDGRLTIREAGRQAGRIGPLRPGGPEDATFSLPPFDEGEVALDEDVLIGYRRVLEKIRDDRERISPEAIIELLRAMLGLIDHVEWLEDLLVDAITMQPCHIPDHAHATPYLCDAQLARAMRRLLANLSIPQDGEEARLTPRVPHADCQTCTTQPRALAWIETGRAAPAPPETEFANQFATDDEIDQLVTRVEADDDLEDLPF